MIEKSWRIIIMKISNRFTPGTNMYLKDRGLDMEAILSLIEL